MFPDEKILRKNSKDIKAKALIEEFNISLADDDTLIIGEKAYLEIEAIKKDIEKNEKNIVNYLKVNGVNVPFTFKDETEVTKKSLKIQDFYQEYTVFLNIGSYKTNNRLGITLDYLNENNGAIMPYADLTVNLPQDKYKIEFNQAFINGGDVGIKFVEDNNLGTVAPIKYQSGYGKLQLVTFDMERLAEFDPDGVKEYMQMHGNSRAKMMEKKNEYEVE